MIQFFGRKEEKALLCEIKERSLSSSQFTVLSGSRRIGKTSLVWETYGKDNILYFYVSTKTENSLCKIFQQEIEDKLGIPMPSGSYRVEQLLDFLMRYSEKQPLTIFIDEFQRFGKIDTSIYSDMQKVWDARKQNAKINLIVGGSAKTLLLRLFEEKSEPLYGRQTATIKLEHFYPSVLKEILAAYNPQYTSDDLLALYSFTGGVARYVELLMDAGAFTKDAMINEIIRPSSIFISEGLNHLIEEFGKDYTTYFDIMVSIATGHNDRAEIESAIGKGIGGQLAMLEDVYGVIRKHQPLFAKSTKNVRYMLDDNFYIFWFRYVFRYNYMLEIKAYDKLRTVIRGDYETFTGKRLEQYFREMLVERQEYTRIDTWWNRKGTAEIDLIAIDELSGKADFYEVKRNKSEYDKSLLEERKDEFLMATHKLNDYTVTTTCLSMDDM